MIQAAGIPIQDVPFVTVGGGIGSFVTVDYLRIAGVPTSQIRVLSNIDYPWQTYEYLTRVSQIPRPERIRSDSSSRPDNIWGFPSYALAEAWRDKSLAHLFHVLVEPVFADYWTPRAGTVFANLERESKRIGYPEMLVKGVVRMVRRRVGGGYFTILTPPEGDQPDRSGSPTGPASSTSRSATRACGSCRTCRRSASRPATTSTSSTRTSRTSTSTSSSRRRPGTVVLRGGGIVASRVLQRLFDDRREVRHADQDRPHLPHVRHRRARPAHLDAAQGRRRLGVPGLQLPEVGVGRPAQGADAQARRRGAGQEVQGDGRHQHAQAPPLAAADGRRAASGGYYHAMQGTVERGDAPARTACSPAS